MAKKVALRLKVVEEVSSKYGNESVEYSVAVAKLEYARKEYDTTPKGIAQLKAAATVAPQDSHIKARLAKAVTTRTIQSNALKEIQSGRYSTITELDLNRDKFLDSKETASILEANREYYERFAIKDAEEKIIVQASASEYQRYLNRVESNLKNRYPEGLPSEVAKKLTDLRSMEAPDSLNMKVYNTYWKAQQRSQDSLYKEISKAADIQGVNRKVTQAYYEAYRNQYNEKYANLPDSERPDPPDAWVKGELGQSGYTSDPSSSFAPRDRASLYAIYRLRSDDNAVPDFLKTSRTVASIDLETAGPPGIDGMKPENGRIIEVGIVSFTPKGKELNRYEQLIKPDSGFLQKYGTGAQNIHQISPEDLRESPSWGQVSNNVAHKLEGKTLLAQNAVFEYQWLAHHLPQFKDNGVPPVIDTLDISRKHLDLPNHRLATICGSLGVPYTNGHRATHDAQVTGEAFFQLQKYIRKTWNSKPARRDAAKLKTVPIGSRWDSWVNPYSR